VKQAVRRSARQLRVPSLTAHRNAARSPTGRLAYVDGRFIRHTEARVHIEDRGLQFADSVYEVCGVVDGRLTDEPEHLDRLERSVAEIQMAMPMSRDALRLVMCNLVRINRVRHGLLYLQVTRGAARRDHPIPEHAPRPTLIMTAQPLDPAIIESRRQSGVAVITTADQRWARCDIKTTQLLPNLLAKTAARRTGAYEAWLVDREGLVTEGTSTTAWIVEKDGSLSTRALSNAILPGVTRRIIFELAAEAQLPIREKSYTPAEAKKAREAFISSATGIYPVTTIDGEAVGSGRPGPVTKRVQELYARRMGTHSGAAQPPL
jgi:D-alanine transaminase